MQIYDKKGLVLQACFAGIHTAGLSIFFYTCNKECVTANAKNQNHVAMGMDINLYTKGLSADLLPEIKKRFADFHMDIEFHPEFRFDEDEDAGFLPIKLKVVPGRLKQYDDFGDGIMTGFELLFSDFDYDEALADLEGEPFIAGKEPDEYLKLCDKDLMLSWGSGNVSETRISLFFAAILAELTDGIIYDPQNGRYLSGKQALDIFPKEIDTYEQSISAGEFNLVKFEGWV
ncbi:MAG: hypothetical protein FD123_690 [Bacteroidetes bacterium]|nr:MAG: hypothetical protein FD123_690 [Bacteroidota bacterium]